MFQIYKGTSPCKDCKKRELGCHSICTDYIGFHLDRSTELKQVKLAKKKDKLQICTDIGTSNWGGF